MVVKRNISKIKYKLQETMKDYKFLSEENNVYDIGRCIYIK